MQAHWSREDLPHWDKIRDADDMAGNGLRSRVIDIALDEVVDHLNANHPKSDDVRRVAAQRDTQKTKARRARRARDKWQAACETATANAQMWMDEAIAQRERADSMEQRAEAAGRELAAANDELSRLRDSLGEWSVDAVRQQMQAWDRLAEHPFFADCYKRTDGSLIDAMIAKLDEELIVTCEVVDEPDPVEGKARELWMVMSGHDDTGDVFTWRNLEERHKVEFRRAARHVLGVDDE